jgi:hypothetical protein
MTETRPSRRPGAAPVFWASLFLFCALLGLLTYRFSIGRDPSGVGASAAPAAPIRKVIVRRVVTTVVPAPASPAAAAAPPAAAAPLPESETVPVSEPVTSAS